MVEAEEDDGEFPAATRAAEQRGHLLGIWQWNDGQATATCIRPGCGRRGWVSGGEFSGVLFVGRCRGVTQTEVDVTPLEVPSPSPAIAEMATRTRAIATARPAPPRGQWPATRRPIVSPIAEEIEPREAPREIKPSPPRELPALAWFGTLHIGNGLAGFWRKGKLTRLTAALEGGQTIREAMRTAGVSKATAGKYATLIRASGDVRCACGQPAGHVGWCRVRYERSAPRQAVVARLHGKASPELPPPRAIVETPPPTATPSMLEARFPKGSRVHVRMDGRALGNATVLGWSRDQRCVRLRRDGLKTTESYHASFCEPL